MSAAMKTNVEHAWPDPFDFEPPQVSALVMRKAFAMASGKQDALEELIADFEHAAILRMRRDEHFKANDEEPGEDDLEEWREFWVNAARTHSKQMGPPLNLIRLDYRQATYAGWRREAIAATNVLLIASDLRTAIKANSAGAASLLSMMLVLELLFGGYAVKSDAIKRSRAKAYKLGAGRSGGDMELARQKCIEWASDIWEKDPTRLIGDVAEHNLGRCPEAC